MAASPATCRTLPVADPITDKTPKAKGLTIGDIANQVGQNKIAINFVWTLVTGFLVMFMQAGFAIVETGLCRAKNANHTMMMNFMVYGVGMLAYWLIGFAIQEGGVAAVLNLGELAGPEQGIRGHHLRQALGHVRPGRVFPDAQRRLRRGRHGAVPLPDGVHGHGADDCDGRGGRALEVRGVHGFLVRHGRVHLSALRATGRGAAAGWRTSARITASVKAMRTSPVPAWCTRSAASRRWRCRMIIGPRIGKFTREGKPNAMPGHDMVIVLTGCFILAFGWFGFNPGSTLGASANGNLRIGSIAVNTMLAGMAG